MVGQTCGIVGIEVWPETRLSALENRGSCNYGAPVPLIDQSFVQSGALLHLGPGIVLFDLFCLFREGSSPGVFGTVQRYCNLPITREVAMNKFRSL